MKHDVIIIGGGAAGLMCAVEAGRRGRKVAVLEHSERLGKKILISGGGRCNFTNFNAGPDNFLSANPHFCKSALARYRPADFIALVEKHGIAYHEKKLGQLFCDLSSRQIVEMLQKECDAARVEIRLNCRVNGVRRNGDIANANPETSAGRTSSPSPREERTGRGAASKSAQNDLITPLPTPASWGEGTGDQRTISAGSRGGHFSVETNQGRLESDSLVVATGGLSFPKIGATDLGYRIATQFGHQLATTRPGLVPLLFGAGERAAFGELSGISVDAVASANGASFRENILFTHGGLSGPAILQISNYRDANGPITLDLLPDRHARELLLSQRNTNKELKTALNQFLPQRFAQIWCERLAPSRPMNRYSTAELEHIAQKLHRWEILPDGTGGYAKAEVTLGGVDTRELSSKTMESRRVPGLYFIGEVVDVTGWLGGYNFQWAWASGHAAGRFV